MGGVILKTTDLERDLGVIIDYNAKPSSQCLAAAKKANRTLGMIKRNIKYKSKDVILRLYKSLVRPQLEYCVQSWCPYLKKDIEVLEKVQRRATRMIEGFDQFNYEKRKSLLKLSSLEKRRIRGDLIEVFKLIKGIDKVDYNIFFKIDINPRVRGHRFKLIKQRFNTNLRKFFFSNRVIDTWNKLPAEVVDSDSVNSFKIRLDKVL